MGVTSLTNDFDIPEGKAFVLVDLVTGLFPQITMDTLDDRYAGDGSGAFEYIQSTPLATWTIPVPLTMARRPNVDVYIADELVDTDVTASTTQVVITFPSPQVGSAVLS